MKISLQYALNDTHLDVEQALSQRQLSISVSAIAEPLDWTVPLNLGLILDCSGSMEGLPLERVKQAVKRIVDQLSPVDQLSLVPFSDQAVVLVSTQELDDPGWIKAQVDQLEAGGGTAIDRGLHLGLEELLQRKQGCISQVFLLTDGENEHGSNDRCLELARLAAQQNVTVNTFGFGDNWNQDVLERIADAGGGSLTYIESPEQSIVRFDRLFKRIQTIGLTNAHLCLSLAAKTQLAKLKPIAQVTPEIVELPICQQQQEVVVRLGDLMTDVARTVLINLYIEQLPVGLQTIARAQVRYDCPAQDQQALFSAVMPIQVEVQEVYQPDTNPRVQHQVLALAKYRRAKIAEMQLQRGDRDRAVTMFQAAAETALQMGDKRAATVFQYGATRLQVGEELSQSDRKRTRIASKTAFQP